MKRVSFLAALAVVATTAAISIGAAGASAASCTATGLVRDGINLTAAIVNPAAPVTGTVDAGGCNIGVYFGPGTAGSVGVADIFGANYYGVVVNAAAVDVTGATIHDIGETPFNGSQHGVGVLAAGCRGIDLALFRRRLRQVTASGAQPVGQIVVAWLPGAGVRKDRPQPSYLSSCEHDPCVIGARRIERLELTLENVFRQRAPGDDVR